MTEVKGCITMKNIQFSDVAITGGFWKAKQKLNRETVIWSVYDRFIETGRFEALKCNWKEGQPNKPHIYWDSDVAKWMESAAYLIKEKPSAKLQKILEKWIKIIGENQEECGYYNSIKNIPLSADCIKGIFPFLGI